MPVDEAESRNCQSAVRALERVIEQRSQEPYEDLAEATRCLVRLRDGLIERKRAGDSSEQRIIDLDEVNSVLSAMHASEFPLVGIRLQRIENARDHLANLLKRI